MRIVMLSQFYPPVIGGLERHVKDLSEALVSRGHHVAVITLKQGGWGIDMPEFEVVNGVRIHRIRGTISRAEGILFIDARRSYAPPFPDPELALSIRRILKEEKPQVVHAHNWLSFSYLPLKKWSGASLVVTLHEFGLSCGKWTFIHRGTFCSGPETRKCFSCLSDHYGPVKGAVTWSGLSGMRKLQDHLIDMYVPVSQAVAEGSQLVGSGLPYRVIPNFIPDAVSSASAERSAYVDQLPTQPFILFVGSFSPQKGIQILVEAFRGITKTHALVMIGYELSDFPLRALDLPDNIHVFKNWPNSAVLEAWERCSLGVVPSNWPEPSPTVVMEAMAMGKPVIASQVGGIPDIIVDGQTGLLVPPGDVAALRQAIQSLVEDQALRTKMGQAARERVQVFRAARVVSQIESLYTELSS